MSLPRTCPHDVVTTESEYVRNIDALLLSTYTSAREPSLLELVRAARGAFPTVVSERLAALHMRWSTRPSDQGIEDPSSPELHALDFEWPFSTDTIARLLDWIGYRSVNLIGLPSVMLQLDPEADACLIERNPLVQARNHWLASRKNFRLGDILTLDLSSIPRRRVVAFDSPWYFGETVLWLLRAVELVEAGGEIGFSLYGESTRPTAPLEREEILTIASRIGDVELCEAELEYVTPRYEACALEAAGLPPLRRWRRGDFVRVTVGAKRARPLQLPLIAQPVPREPWITYRVGRQVVKLRRPNGRRLRDEAARVPFAPIEALGGWAYPSVSLRDELRGSIHLWTSRNQVAQVLDHDVVRQRLEALEKAAARGLSTKRWLSRYDWAGRQEEARAWRELLRVDLD